MKSRSLPWGFLFGGGIVITLLIFGVGFSADGLFLGEELIFSGGGGRYRSRSHSRKFHALSLSSIWCIFPVSASALHHLYQSQSVVRSTELFGWLMLCRWCAVMGWQSSHLASPGWCSMNAWMGLGSVDRPSPSMAHPAAEWMGGSPECPCHTQVVCHRLVWYPQNFSASASSPCKHTRVVFSIVGQY